MVGNKHHIVCKVFHWGSERNGEMRAMLGHFPRYKGLFAPSRADLTRIFRSKHQGLLTSIVTIMHSADTPQLSGNICSKFNNEGCTYPYCRHAHVFITCGAPIQNHSASTAECKVTGWNRRFVDQSSCIK